MRVIITDDNENWRKWGELVRDWIEGNEARPGSTEQLKQMMEAREIQGDVPGVDRPLRIVDYSEDIVYIFLPPKAMMLEKFATIEPDKDGKYPLPLFYDVAYSEPKRAVMSPAEKQAFALRRIGEYTVNECC